MRTRIVVHLEGGLVQSVSSNSPIDAEVVVIDYDTEGAEQEEIHRVPQSDDPGVTFKVITKDESYFVELTGGF